MTESEKIILLKNKLEVSINFISIFQKYSDKYDIIDRQTYEILEEFKTESLELLEDK